MGWYANLKIGTKLLLGFAAVIIISSVMGLASIRGMGKIDDLLVEINKTIMVQIVYSNDLNYNVTLHNRRALRHILATGKDDMQQIRSQMQLNELAIRDLLEKFQATRMDITEQRLLERFVRGWPDYVTITGQIIRLSADGRKHDALQLAETKGRDQYHDLENALAELIRFNVAEGKLHDDEASELYRTLRFSLAALMIFSIMLAASVAWRITNSVVSPVHQVLTALRSLTQGAEEKLVLVEAISNGDLSQQVRINEPLKLDGNLMTRDEAGELLKATADISIAQHTVDTALATMTDALRRNRNEEQAREWLKNGINGLNVLVQGDWQLQKLAEQSLSYLCSYLGAAVGAFYLWNDRDGTLEMAASHAFTPRDAGTRRFQPGEGIVGQAAREKRQILLHDVPAEYLTVISGLGKAEPLTLAALPLIHDSRLVGAVEIGSFIPFGTREQALLDQAREVLAAGVGVNISRRLVDDLLEQTQTQTEELRVQQEELQQTNEELEERAQLMEQQQAQIKAKNKEVEEASAEIRRKAEELAQISSYKSEFLANMSHELRTPLNSLMILSSLLKDNREGNLTDKQVEYAATINGAGKDLLNLINDILDLSKIESGKLEFQREEVSPADICDQLRALFEAVATERGLSFEVSIDASVPTVLQTDGLRTLQVLKNLVSNAIKFTRSGGVSVRLFAPPTGVSPLPVPAIAFAIADSGIGIPADKHELIFQAFHQADGSTSRTYGGTGLGLSISRQLARGMGGEITLDSTVGSGSCFTLYLPLSLDECVERTAPPAAPHIPAPSPPPAPPATDTILPPLFIPDDRDELHEGDRFILIIEDDPVFAKVLAETVRKRGFKVLAAGNGEGGIILAERFIPSAIILDVMLPGLDGWGVMRRLKDNLRTRHIPVHFVTCLEDRAKAMSMGALGFYTKPVTAEGLDQICGAVEEAIEKSGRNLLIVEDDKAEASSLEALLSERGVSITVAYGGAEALSYMSRIAFDCIVLDLGLSDMSGFEVLERISKLEPNRRIPVIVHSGRELTRTEELQIRHYAESIIIKGTKSPERLLNEVSIFLHLVENGMEPEKQRMIRAALDSEAMLSGKKILLVDDDMRNIFSLSSVLAEKGIEVVEAENGKESLACLEEHQDIDLVLMDIMMPVMDGLTAIRAIRENPRLRDLPIIALTAKAMKGDREECLKAGASDYIAKPVDLDKLFSLLRVWLYGKG